MNTFQISAKIICLSIILFNFSCSIIEQKKQAEKQTNQQANIEEIKENKIEIIRGRNAELTVKGITQNRDMTQYDQGGYFDCRSVVTKDEPRGECSENKVRDFIWQNWTEKKRGYIRITHDTYDSTSTSHIFIEPNEKDEWRIIWRIMSIGIPGYGNQLTDVLGIVSVEQVENKPEKGMRALVFKNKSGKVLEKIPDFYE